MNIGIAEALKLCARLVLCTADFTKNQRLHCRQIDELTECGYNLEEFNPTRTANLHDQVTRPFIPMDKTRRHLYTLLAEFYPDQPSAVRIAQDAGIRTELVPWTNHALNNWHAILQEAEKQHRLAQLLAVVDEEYGENPRWLARKGEMPSLPFPSASLIQRAISAGRTRIGLLLFGLLVMVGIWRLGQPFVLDRAPTPTPAVTGVSPTLAPAPSSFTYGVTVKDAATNQPIANANVRIEVEGKAPLTEYADSNGFARIFIPAILAEHPGRLTVEAAGYEVDVRNIDLWPDRLPAEIRLTQE